MKKRTILFVCLILAIAGVGYAQDVGIGARNKRWKEFSSHNFEKFDFAKTRLVKTRIAGLKEDENADDFALLRGVVFGKHGRIFKERSIQDYLEKQSWYTKNANYSNRVLTAIERANLDLIRVIEAEKH